METAWLARCVAAGAGFLSAVLWMDLMFDVQVLGAADPRAALPEAVLASIAAYYRRVTTDASPMGRGIALVMAATLAAAVVQAMRAGGPFWLRALSPFLAATAITAAFTRVVPNAIALGSRSGSPAEQSALARAILHAHVLCFACMVVLLVVQLAAFTP